MSLQCFTSMPLTKVDEKSNICRDLGKPLSLPRVVQYSWGSCTEQNIQEESNIFGLPWSPPMWHQGWTSARPILHTVLPEVLPIPREWLGLGHHLYCCKTCKPNHQPLPRFRKMAPNVSVRTKLIHIQINCPCILYFPHNSGRRNRDQGR